MANKRVQWFIVHSTSYQLLYRVDSLVLRNPLLHEKPKRLADIVCGQIFDKIIMWSFDRERDASNIKTEEMNWQGPFSWQGFEYKNNLPSTPYIGGVYLFTFKFRDVYILYGAGITNSTRRRLSGYNREYKKGNYTVLDVVSAEQGLRKEIRHGWQYAKTHQDEFIQNKEKILKAVVEHLNAYRIFVAPVSDNRIRERIESAIMQNIYNSTELWSE